MSDDSIVLFLKLLNPILNLLHPYESSYLLLTYDHLVNSRFIYSMFYRNVTVIYRTLLTLPVTKRPGRNILSAYKACDRALLSCKWSLSCLVLSFYTFWTQYYCWMGKSSGNCLIAAYYFLGFLFQSSSEFSIIEIADTITKFAITMFIREWNLIIIILFINSIQYNFINTFSTSLLTKKEHWE